MKKSLGLLVFVSFGLNALSACGGDGASSSNDAVKSSGACQTLKEYASQGFSDSYDYAIIQRLGKTKAEFENLGATNGAGRIDSAMGILVAIHNGESSDIEKARDLIRSVASDFC
jgi:hypothetical protein